MKTRLIITASIATLLLIAVSCGNRNAKTKSNDLTSKAAVESQKNVLADSVLAVFDAMAEQFSDIPGTDAIMKIKLTDKEKLLKPTYLLEPEIAGTLVAKKHKVNAIAILIVETAMRKAYDMPTDKSVEAIVKLSTELNYPLAVEEVLNSDISFSEKARNLYLTCKNRGDVAYFWIFHFAFITEMQYLIANNPDLFLSRLSDEQLNGFFSKYKGMAEATRELAKYDGEMHMLDEFIKSNMVSHNLVIDNKMFKDKDMARESFISYKNYFIDIRKSLLD